MKIVKPRPSRKTGYGPDLLAPLITCWALLSAPTGMLLARMLPSPGGHCCAGTRSRSSPTRRRTCGCA